MIRLLFVILATCVVSFQNLIGEKMADPFVCSRKGCKARVEVTYKDKFLCWKHWIELCDE